MNEVSYKIFTTDIGLTKLDNAINAGVKVNIKSIKFGDSNGAEYTPAKEQEELKNIVHTSKDEHINFKSFDGLLSSIEVVIPENTPGEFWIREMGVYDADGDLIFISAIPPRKKTDPNTGSAVGMVFGVEVDILNADNIEFTSNSSLTYVTQAAYDLGMADKLDKTAKAKSAITADKLGNQLPGYYAKQVDVDAIQGIQHAATKPVFDALREKRIRDGAGSGFTERGKHRDNGDSFLPINEGLYAYTLNANELLMGRDSNNSSAVGVSGTGMPIVEVNGVIHKIELVNAGLTYGAKLAFPPAPDGTKTYDSATGVVTQHTSAVEAFEGFCNSGDFRDGSVGWITSGSYLSAISIDTLGAHVDGTQASASCYLDNSGTRDFSNDTVDIEVVISGMTAGTVTVLNDSTVNKELIITKSGTYNLKNVTTLGDNIYFQFDTDFIGTIKYFSVRKSTEQVITSRQDFVFLESFHEKIVGKDGSGSRRFHPLGGTQFGASTWNGITLNKDYAQGYSAFGEWDTVTHGYSKSWDDMNIFERELAAKDHDNNIYSDDGNLIQVKYRIRVIEGLGDEWYSVEANSSVSSWRYDSKNYIRPKGSKIHNQDLNTSQLYAGLGTTHPAEAKDVGMMSARNNTGANDGVAHDSLCFAIPIALVQRRNQGAYHPTYNSNGCTSWWTADRTSSSNVAWHETAPYKANSKAECFNDFNDGGYVDFTNGGIGGSSKHKAGLFYDAIYASDVIADLRMSSRRVPKQELEEYYLRKAIAGEIRGAESVPFTKFITSYTFSGNPSNILDDGYSLYVAGGTDDYSLRLNDVWVDGRVSGSNIPEIYITDAGAIIAHLIVKDSGNYTRNPDFIHTDTNFGLPLTSGSSLQTSYLVIASYDTLHKQVNPTWTDLACDPEQGKAALPNGVEGQWIPVIPNDSGTVSFPLNKKDMDTHFTRISTVNNGGSWVSEGFSAHSTLNTVISSSTNESARVSLFSYEAKANFTQDDTNSKVLSEGSVYATNHYYPSQGSEMVSSLIGKVATDNTNPRQFTTNINGVVINSGVMEVVTNDAPSHAPILLGSNGISPAVKAYNYLSSENGVAKIVFLYREMRYKSGRFKPWGDDNKFSLTDFQSFRTDLNGKSLLEGTASFNCQHFIVDE